MKNGAAYIPDEIVSEIRASYTGKWGDQARICREFDLKPMWVSQVLRGNLRRAIH